MSFAPPLPVHPDPVNGWRWDCTNVGDGGSLVFTAYFGGLFAAIYAGWWDMAWTQYHKRKTGLIDKGFKADPFSLFVRFIAIAIPIIIIAFSIYTRITLL